MYRQNKKEVGMQRQKTKKVWNVNKEDRGIMDWFNRTQKKENPDSIDRRHRKYGMYIDRRQKYHEMWKLVFGRL